MAIQKKKQSFLALNLPQREIEAKIWAIPPPHALQREASIHSRYLLTSATLHIVIYGSLVQPSIIVWEWHWGHWTSPRVYSSHFFCFTVDQNKQANIMMTGIFILSRKVWIFVPSNWNGWSKDGIWQEGCCVGGYPQPFRGIRKLGTLRIHSNTCVWFKWRKIILRKNAEPRILVFQHCFFQHLLISSFDFEKWVNWLNIVL